MYNTEFESAINAQFSKNLRFFLEKNDLTQLDFAKKMNVSTATVSNWCKGIKSPRMDKVDLMCKIFNCSRSDLVEDKGSLIGKKKSKSILIPVLGRVAAGIPIEATTEIIDTEEIPEEMAKTGDFFALKIKGNSMEPRIMDGDVVIVRKQDEAENGDVIIAMVNGDDATCKRLRKYKDGIELISNNPSYKPMFFSDMDVQTKPVRIIGKVVELRGKF